MLVSVQEAARFSGLSADTIRRAFSRGQISGHRDPEPYGTVLIDPNSALAYKQGLAAPRECRVCGKIFTPTMSTQVYCSRQCCREACTPASGQRIYHHTCRGLRTRVRTQSTSRQDVFQRVSEARCRISARPQECPQSRMRDLRA